MTLYAGCLRLRGLGQAEEVRSTAAASWVLLPDGPPLAVVIGSRSGLVTQGRDGGQWLVPPIPILQVGFRPENDAAYGRLVVGAYRPEVALTAAGLSRSLLPAVAERDGFAATLVACAPATGVTFSLSLWSSEAAATSNQDDGWFASRVALFRDCYVAPPQTVGGPLFMEGRR